jgi:polar amino acid transport system substrate-binding protein
MKRARTIAVLLGSLFFVGASFAAELKFVTEPFPPFSYEVAGTSKGAGPIADVIDAVCAKIKATCSIEVLPWRRAYSMAENGEVDGIFSFLRTPEREKLFLISDMIVDGAISLFAAESSTFKYSKPKDLDGYTIGVYGPSGTATVLEDTLKAGSTGRPEVDTNNVLVLKKLAGGRYGEGGKGLAVINRDVGLYLMKSEGITGLKQVGDLQRIAYGIGFPKKKVQEAQFNEFNEALKALIKEGKVKTILDKHGMKPAA